MTSITATAIGVSNELEFMQRLSTGDICFYGTTKNNQIKLPIEWKETSKQYLQTQVDKNVTINNTIYYDTYKSILSSTGEWSLLFSENLYIDLDKCKFHFLCKSGIKKCGKDARFLLDLIENKSFKIGNAEFKYNSFDLPDGFEDELRFMDDLCKTLSDIEFDYDKQFWDLSLAVRKQLMQIVGIKNVIGNKMVIKTVNVFNWKIEDKYMPVIVIKRDDGSVELTNGVFAKHLVAVKNDKGEYFKVPLYGYSSKEILANLYYYKYDSFYEQIDKGDVNEYTIDSLNHAALRLIHAYDINGDMKLLDIAEYQLMKIKEFEKDKIYYKINMLQIKKRRGMFSSEDITSLKGLNTENIQELFGINVLLEDKERAKKNYDEMEREEKKIILECPIYYLYQNL